VAPVAGTRLFYEMTGTGPPLVLIHGFTLDSRMWDGQMDALAMRHQVIRYDMRGFGHSALPEEESYSAAGDLKALLDYVGVDTAAIIGLSLGGGVAVDFALTYPDRTRALILADGVVGGWEWSSGWNERVGAVWSAGRESGIEAAKERWLALPLFVPAQEQPNVARLLRVMVSDYSGWHWLRQDSQQYLDPPALQRLGSVTAPTLIILGERDAPDFHAIAAAFQRSIPGAESVTIPGVGHMVNMEAIEQFNDIVLRFLDER
jgi:pimeloyl-ACP methyl ester carboxylesterase